MTGPYSECPIRLHRDALNTPWGFRLQGGKDFKVPLSVQRVFVGSPADGELHRGDILVAIDNYDANNLTHKQAQDIIRNAGGSLSLRIKRGAGYTEGPKPITFGAPIVAGPPASSSQPASVISYMLMQKIGRYRLGQILNSLSIYSQYRTRPLESIAPKPAPPIGAFSPKTGTGMQSKYGVDYGSGQYGRPAANPPGGSMLQKVSASLNQSIWSHEDNQEQDYEPKPIGEIKKIFSEGAPNQHMPAFAQTGASYKPARRQPWRKPQTDGTALQEPGWTPKTKPVHAPVRVPQSAPATVPVNRAPPQQQYQPTQQHQRRQAANERPPWSGSLRSSGGPKPWEIQAGEHLVPGAGEVHVPTGPSSVPRQATPSAPFQPQQHHQPAASPNVQPHSPMVQNVHYGPGGPQYQQLSPRAADPDTAKVVHAQYNSPLALYSKENVQAALEGQTTGKPGEGTMQVTGGGAKKTFNPAQSDVYRLLQEEEEIAGQRHVQHHAPHVDQSARHQEQQPGQEMHYVGYVDPSTKSPSMMALEAQVLDEGTSDF